MDTDKLKEFMKKLADDMNKSADNLEKILKDYILALEELENKYKKR